MTPRARSLRANVLRAKHALAGLVCQVGSGPTGLLLHLADGPDRSGPWPGAWARPLVARGWASVVARPDVVLVDAPADAVWLSLTGAGLMVARDVEGAPSRVVGDLRYGTQASRAFWRSGQVRILPSTPAWGGERVHRVG